MIDKFYREQIARAKQFYEKRRKTGYDVIVKNNPKYNKHYKKEGYAKKYCIKLGKLGFESKIFGGGMSLQYFILDEKAGPFMKFDW